MEIKIDINKLPESLRHLATDTTYNHSNEPIKAKLPDSYTNNVWDGLHNSIAQLYSMLQEIKQQDRVFLSEDTTARIVKELIEDDSQYVDVEELLRHGHKGYENMSDLEICVEVQNTIAGWCGMKGNDELKFGYELVNKEVEQAISLILSEVVEKSCL
jgi:hypothetical protein